MKRFYVIDKTNNQGKEFLFELTLENMGDMDGALYFDTRAEAEKKCEELGDWAGVMEFDDDDIGE